MKKRISSKKREAGILDRVYQDFKNRRKLQERKEVKLKSEQIKKDLEKIKQKDKEQKLKEKEQSKTEELIKLKDKEQKIKDEEQAQIEEKLELKYQEINVLQDIMP